MNRQIELQTPNGIIRGNWIDRTQSKGCVVLNCGHNGFYHYGMFPTIQAYFEKQGLASVTFNYTHTGISGDGDYFDQLDKYEKNCRRLEVEDTLFILDWLKRTGKYSDLWLLGHSMGGITATFSAVKWRHSKEALRGVILLNSLKTLDVRSKETMDEWIQNGVYYRFNPRTLQELPQGYDFLQETLASDREWSMKNALSELHLPVFIAHAELDEAVPFEHGTTLSEWLNPIALNTFLAIPDATHTLNTKHPTVRESEQLNYFLDRVLPFITATRSE